MKNPFIPTFIVTAPVLLLTCLPLVADNREQVAEKQPSTAGVVKSVNGLSGRVTITGGPGVTVSAADTTLVISAGSSGNSNVWQTSGNAGTIAGPNFLGTTDNQPLELKVNNQRAVRLEYGAGMDTFGDTYHFINVIGGSSANAISNGVLGGTIAGGGGVGQENRVDGDGGFVGGGFANAAAGSGMVGGGFANYAGQYCTVAGGFHNTITNPFPGGAVGGFIGGGTDNTIARDYGTVGGGLGNNIKATGYAATIGGGQGNSVEGGVSTISGGFENRINNSEWASIGGGYNNYIGTNSRATTIAGGSFNRAGNNSEAMTIGGGQYNTIEGNARQSTIAGGYLNMVESLQSTIGGGADHRIERGAANSTIGGGSENIIRINADFSTVSGGRDNTIEPSASYSTIGGGRIHTIYPNSQYATIPGGWFNAAASYSFAAGTRAKANHTGSFVWGDSTDADIVSIREKSATMRAAGGYRFFSDSAATVGVALEPGGGSWINMSDRKAKDNFAEVNGREILEKVASMPLRTWNYKSQPENIRHIGPTAQDFKAAFNLGETDTGIATVDADGVALAAIQGLNQKLEEKVQEKEAQITELKQTVATLKGLVEKLIAQKHNEPQTAVNP